MKIKGNAQNHAIWVNGMIVSPEPSQKIFNHSPDGFAWGYGGSGPAQLALALTMIAAQILNIPFAAVRPFYQDVKSEFVAKWPMADDFEGVFNIEGFLAQKLEDQNHG